MLKSESVRWPFTWLPLLRFFAAAFKRVRTEVPGTLIGISFEEYFSDVSTGGKTLKRTGLALVSHTEETPRLIYYKRHLVPGKYFYHQLSLWLTSVTQLPSRSLSVAPLILPAFLCWRCRDRKAQTLPKKRDPYR
jgi:hypothetical protein